MRAGTSIERPPGRVPACHCDDPAASHGGDCPPPRGGSLEVLPDLPPLRQRRALLPRLRRRGHRPAVGGHRVASPARHEGPPTGGCAPISAISRPPNHVTDRASGPASVRAPVSAGARSWPTRLSTTAVGVRAADRRARRRRPVRDRRGRLLARPDRAFQHRESHGRWRQRRHDGPDIHRVGHTTRRCPHGRRRSHSRRRSPGRPCPVGPHRSPGCPSSRPGGDTAAGPEQPGDRRHRAIARPRADHPHGRCVPIPIPVSRDQLPPATAGPLPRLNRPRAFTGSPFDGSSPSN